MAAKVLLVGLKLTVVDDIREQVGVPDVELFAGAGLADAQAVLAGHTVDHVIMGAGLDLELRLEVVRTVFQYSDRTTVHMKDFASGPEGFAPFVRAVLAGMRDFQPGPAEDH